MTTIGRRIGSGILWLLLSATTQAQLETVWQQVEMGYEVSALALLPDGSGMITVSASGARESGMLRLWQLPEGNYLHTLSAFQELPRQHALSSDGEFLLTIGLGGFRVWRLSTRSLAYEVPVPSLGQGIASVESAFLTPDGQRIIASLSGCVHYETDGDCTGYVYAIACLQVPNGGIVWDRVSMDYDMDLLAMSPDGHWLVISGDEVQVLNAQTGELRYELPVTATSAAFSPDGQQFALGKWSGALTLHRAADGAVIRTFSAAHQYRVKSVAFSPDGTRLVSVGEDRLVRVWNLIDGTLIRSLRAHSPSVSMALFLGNESLLTAGADGRDRFVTGSVKLWRLSDGSLSRLWTGPYQRMMRVTFSSDGERLVTADMGGMLHFWRAADGVMLQRLFAEPVEREVYALRFSPDGRTLAIGGQDGMLRLWDLVQGGFPHFFTAHPAGISTVRFLPNGSLIITGGYDRMVKLWNATNRLLVRTLEGHLGGVTAVDVSPDGSLIASASFDETIRLWHTSTGALLRLLSGHRGVVWAVAFSPDGSRLFSGGADGTVRVWDVGTGTLIHMWQAHPGGVYQLDISPAGHLLASLGEDGVLRFWNARTGALLFSHILPDRYRPVAFAFSPVFPYFGYVFHYQGWGNWSIDSLLELARVYVPGDVDRNGCVGDSDLLAVLFAFGQTGTDLPEDVDRNGIVDDGDLLTLLFNWGIGC